MADVGDSSKWDTEIIPRRGWLDLRISELIRYRDLLFLFVRRDFVATYKQTVLGPLWYIIQPLLTTLMMTLVFGNIAGLSTDGLPKVLFYLSGVTLWGYLASTLTKTANTFVANASLFGKVYFPRLITPVGVVISNLVQLSIQMALFLVFWGAFWSQGSISPNVVALFFPFLILIVAILSLGLGLVFTALTTKYRDLSQLLAFGVQLFMYATPIIYPMSTIPEKYSLWIALNPMTAVVETFRFGFLGVGDFSVGLLAYSTVLACIVFLVGVIIFNKVEATFVDTV